MAYHFCVDLSTVEDSSSVIEGETCIMHVKFHGTGRNDYKVYREKLERTLLTDYLNESEGPDFDQKLMKLTFDIKPAEANSFCKSVLERGIFCLQHPYFFLGHSDEQLKTKSCYLMRATQEEILKLLAKFGDFLEEKNLGKRARNIGMLFSPLNKVVPLEMFECKMQADITGGITGSYIFTDGCGFMSPEFSSEVQRIFELDYHPSAVQVRYRGIDGMLVLKKDMTDVKVLFHNSMQKFVTPVSEHMPEGFRFANVVDYSRPYVNGYLDTRMVMLLADRGVSADTLHKMQTGYHELLEDMCGKTSEAEYFLRFKGEFRLLRDIQGAIDSTIKKRLKDLRKQELDEMEKAAYTRILVPESRVVFAVCDPYNKLKYGECYFNPTMPEDEAKVFPAGQEFVVTRNPCYHPGDVRVLKMTKEKYRYENLRDCLVLPVEGPRPHAFECFGGDLSGNKFFVSWDKNLIPSVKENPCDYSPTVVAQLRQASVKSVSKALEKFRKGHKNKELKSREEMLEYFATFSDEIPRMIEGEYMKCATALGPSSKQCRQLSKMLYQAASLSEDSGKLRKELEQMKPSIESALFSGSQNEQDVEDRNDYSDEESSTRPDQESSSSLNDDATQDAGGHRKARRPTLKTMPFRQSKDNSKRLRLARSEIWKNIDKIAKDFVEGMRRESRLRVV